MSKTNRKARTRNETGDVQPRTVTYVPVDVKSAATHFLMSGFYDGARPINQLPKGRHDNVLLLAERHR